MLEKNLRFINSVGHAVNMPSDEPSHIHVPRPSRLLRRDTSGSSVEPTDEVRDLAAAEVTAQAA